MSKAKKIVLEVITMLLAIITSLVFLDDWMTPLVHEISKCDFIKDCIRLTVSKSSRPT